MSDENRYILMNLKLNIGFLLCYKLSLCQLAFYIVRGQWQLVSYHICGYKTIGDSDIISNIDINEIDSDYNKKTMRDYLEIISGIIKLPCETPAPIINSSLLGPHMKCESLYHLKGQNSTANSLQTIKELWESS